MVKSVHDISSGGILLALSEMCLSGDIGAKITIPRRDINIYEYLFGEDQSRYLVEIDKKNSDKISNLLERGGVYYEIIAKTQKEKLELDNNFSIDLKELRKLYTSWFTNYFDK